MGSVCGGPAASTALSYLFFSFFFWDWHPSCRALSSAATSTTTARMPPEEHRRAWLFPSPHTAPEDARETKL